MQVLVKEEVLAREKLEALKLLLDSTNQVGLQVIIRYNILYSTSLILILVFQLIVILQFAVLSWCWYWYFHYAVCCVTELVFCFIVLLSCYFIILLLHYLAICYTFNSIYLCIIFCLTVTVIREYRQQEWALDFILSEIQPEQQQSKLQLFEWESNEKY